MKDLVMDIVKALVDNPDEIVITEIEGQRVTMIELRVAKEDLGKVIGKQGRNAQAIRTIVSAASAKMNRRFSLEILE